MYIKEYIKMPDLKDGYLYRIIARNASYGIWKESTSGFIISRDKFGHNYLFEEYHYDCEAFATAQPIKEIEKAPFQIKHNEGHDSGGEWDYYDDEEEILAYLNKFESR